MAWLPQYLIHWYLFMYTSGLIDRFRFAEIMQESIPVLRKHIKEASMADLRVRVILTGWLYWLLVSSTLALLDTH